MSKSHSISEQLHKLGGILEYSFTRNPELLTRALTHRSFGPDNYERLEFLGDSILGFIIADAIYERFPDADEGQMTRLRASLVKQSTLAAIGRELDIGRFVRLGPGALKSGDHARDSVISDVLEAIIGAIYLDGGLRPCREFVHRIFTRRLSLARPGQDSKDPKTRLQEFLQADSMDLPEYKIIDVSGPPHKQLFTVQCLVEGGKQVFVGTGSSRRRAEQDSAEHALLELMR